MLFFPDECKQANCFRGRYIPFLMKYDVFMERGQEMMDTCKWPAGSSGAKYLWCIPYQHGGPGANQPLYHNSYFWLSHTHARQHLLLWNYNTHNKVWLFSTHAFKIQLSWYAGIFYQYIEKRDWLLIFHL